MTKRGAWRLGLGAVLGAGVLHCSVGGERPPVYEPPEEDASVEPRPSVVVEAGPSEDVDDASVADVVAPTETEPPSFSTSRKEIDFGMVGCGKMSPPIVLSLNNTGASTFTWSAKLLAGATSQFTIAPATGTLAPGASETLSVTMKEVPFPASTAANFYDDVLTLDATTSTTPGAPRAQSEIPIKLTAKGAVVRLSPSAVVFGAVPLNQTSSATFGIINEGNAEIELDLVGANARFETTPLGPVIIQAGANATRTVTFSAIDVTPQTGEVKLESSNPANVLCAPLPTKGLAVTGVGSNGSVAISPGALSFGDSGFVDCGSQADARSVNVHNTGNAAFNWEAKLSSGAAFYTLSPTSGTVQPGQTTAVQVIPKPVPQASAVTQDLYAGTVEITTTAVNDPLHVISLHQTARGIILDSSVGAQLDFGGVKIGTTAVKTFSLTNNGNVPVTASFSLNGAPFSVTPSVTLGPNETRSPTIEFTPPAGATYSDVLIVTAPSPGGGGPPRCAPLPPNAALEGSGSTSISVSPASLSFGLVDCGTTAGHQTVSLTNTGPTTTFTAVFGKDASTSYTLANDDTGAPVPVAAPVPVGAGETFRLRVIPKAITAPASTISNAFGDTLTLTTTTPGDAPKMVQLNMTARGAFLALNPISITGQDDACGHTKFYNFQVINSGNLPGDYTVAVVPRAGVQPTTFSINLSEGSLFGGQSQAGVLEMLTPSTPTAGGAVAQYLSDIVLTPKPGTILCSDAQPKAPVSLDTKCQY